MPHDVVGVRDIPAGSNPAFRLLPYELVKNHQLDFARCNPIEEIATFVREGYHCETCLGSSVGQSSPNKSCHWFDSNLRQIVKELTTGESTNSRKCV